mgnify:CR=1 FL=1|jgi:hypothetical protein
MTKEEYYAEERAYEAAIERECERQEREEARKAREEEDDWDEFEDEWQAHGFRDEADYNRYRFGSSRYL